MQPLGLDLFSFRDGVAGLDPVYRKGQFIMNPSD